MSSVSSANSALRSLQKAVAALNTTQSRLSTGFKIEGAKDNAAYWSISTGMRSEGKSLSAVKDTLNLGAATVATAYQGLNSAREVLDTLKAKLTAAEQPGADRGALQSEIAALQQQLRAIAGTATMSGENWLAVDSSSATYAATREIVSSVGRDGSGAVTIGTIKVDAGRLALFDRAQPSGGGVLGRSVALQDASGRNLSNGGRRETVGNRIDAGLTAATGSSAGYPASLNVMNMGVKSGSAAVAELRSDLGGDPSTIMQVSQSDGFNLNTGEGRLPKPGYNRFTLEAYDNGGNRIIFNEYYQYYVGAPLSSMVSRFMYDNYAYNDNIKLTVSGNIVTASYDTRYISSVTAAGLPKPSQTVAFHITTPGSSVPATSASLNSSLSAIGIADGDVITVSYRLGPSGAVQTHDVTVADAATFDNAAFTAAWGTVPDVTVAAGSGSDVTFTHSGVTGAASQFTLTDVVVRSSAATGSVIKNIDPLGGITGSKAASVKTGILTWPGGLAASDRVSVKLAGVASLYTVAAGASLDDFVANLNTAFAGAYAASHTAAGELVLTAGTTGAGSSVAVESIAFADASGVAKAVTTTGLGLVVQPPSLTSGAFSAFTLDANDALSFSLQTGADPAREVRIDQALVNTVLGVEAEGAVASAADYKRVMDAALAKAGVSGVTTSLGSSPADADKLSFTGQLGQPLTIGAVTVSQGGPTMSVDRLDVSDTALAALGVASGDDRNKVLAAYLGVVNSAISGVTASAAYLGTVAARIDAQKSFTDTLLDSIDEGVGALVDADMDAESTRLQALQVQQQLGVQALSMINRSARDVLRLFR
ncbi:flagellin [Aureimonas phyllosphaerae]|uniref:Flagellin n=1 Tax=Aureimonas phyllosphaerae TaxID=1166078 RepID=A0A7W6C0Q7_9HYPH|nr:flagellin [Aureimonas phyllosphaerae]MBB3937271.1 flagellin-like hook-associated protein FlgL [Aureimonas phyllosphaerae]MBB3961278.1 flagellin-like hook-associated protein FlgL [Aureimonas phyllosphaerae]